MGIFKYDETNKVVSNRTGTGFFIRLDDLGTGYTYEIKVRDLFLNPNKINTRVVLPMSSYEFISGNHKIDFFYYTLTIMKNLRKH